MAKTNKTAAGQQPVPAGYVPSLKKAYKEQIVDALMKQFNYTTVMQVPKLIKITINEGLGEGTQDKKIVEEAAAELSVITGQKALVTVSKKDISNFKLRKGMPVGCKVTLRDVKMYEFLKEQIIFPEVDVDKNPRIHGLEITFVTSAKSDEECRALLAAFGVPFKKRNN